MNSLKPAEERTARTKPGKLHRKTSRELSFQGVEPQPAANSRNETSMAINSSRAADISDTTAIFKFLTSPRFTDKYTAIDWLNDASKKIDRVLLRSYILNALRTDYSVETQQAYGDNSIGDTRSWLLSALGTIITASDDEATEEIAKHIKPSAEPNRWARYWALQGLIAGENSRVLQVAREASQSDDDDDRLTSYLGLAFLASKGDGAAKEQIKADLEKPACQWFVLRALRIVPLQFTGLILCALVNKEEYNDQTYDAIVALGQFPSDSSIASLAAQTLSAAIVRMRGQPWFDAMRTAAVIALGNLKVESSGPLLLEELTDYNPAIVREAARSIIKVLELQATVTRVVEAAAKSATPTTRDALARALRWMDRDAVVEELVNLMGSGSVAQQEMARLLLPELGGAAAYQKLRSLTDATKQYREILERAEDKVQVLFEQTVHEAQKGFQLATWMDAVVFGVGILLIIASAIAALRSSGNIEAWAGVGGIGVLGVLYTLLISNPRRQVREAVDHLMQVKIVFLAYLRRLHQTDQAYTRLLLSSEKVTIEQLKDYSDIVGTIMAGTAMQLGEAVPPTARGSADHHGDVAANGSAR